MYIYNFLWFTAPPDEPPGGVIAGVIIAIILLCVAIVALVAAVMVYMRWKVKVTYIPPPSRKGSMRLVSVTVGSVFMLSCDYKGRVT